MPTKKRVLITGAAGFIGSHLVERCLSLGWEVIAVDAFTDYYDEALKRANALAFIEHPRCTLIEGDLVSLDLPPLLDGVGAVFHLAAQPGVRASWDAFDIYVKQNLTATQRLLDAVRPVGVERFVLASSSSIYGDAEAMPTPEDTVPRPVSPYGVTKVGLEHLASVYWRNYRVPTVCLRYFTVYGPRQRPDMAFNRLIRCALRGESFQVFGDGTQTRDFTFVFDAVSATVAAVLCGRPGSAYNVGGGSRRSMRSVFETIGELLGEPVKLAHRDRQAGDARDTAADISLAKRDLSYEPSFDFTAGLRAQLDWQRVTADSRELLW